MRAIKLLSVLVLLYIPVLSIANTITIDPSQNSIIGFKGRHVFHVNYVNTFKSIEGFTVDNKLVLEKLYLIAKKENKLLEVSKEGNQIKAELKFKALYPTYRTEILDAKRSEVPKSYNFITGFQGRRLPPRSSKK